MVRLDRQAKKPNGITKSGGGLGIYYKNTLDIDATLYANLNVSNANLELQWVVLSRPHTKQILIGNIYRPPDGGAAEAFGQIEYALEQITSLAKYEVLLMGDFNVDCNKKTGNLAHPYIKKLEAEFELQQMITDPTRYAKSTCTTIDLAFTNIKYCSGSGVLNYNISDHKPIFIIKKKPRNCKAATTFYGRSYKDCSHKKLNDELNKVNTTNVLEDLDPNACWDKLEEIIINAADILCPIIEMKVRVNTVQYLNHELLELQKDRDYFVGKADLSKDAGDKFISGCMVKKARTELEKARSGYYQNQAIKHKQDYKKFWRDIKSMEPDANQIVSNITDIQTGDKIPERKLPESVNDFFAKIGASLASKFTDIDKKDKSYIPITNDTSYELQAISKEEVKRILNEMSPDKASGMADISSAFLMSAISILIDEFTHLYNIIISDGTFPDKWKIATITPIPKVSNPKTCSELRPISILPLPSKIFEHMINNQIKQHLEDSGYLADQQNGFRKNRSTTKSLAILLDGLLTSVDAGDLAVTVFLDFKKAFDTVDHHILLWKLGKAGLGEKTCKLLTSYLRNRKQATKIGNLKSSLERVDTGVPQGSVLGPLLFLVYINDFPSISKLPLYTFFADDTTITIRGKCLSNIAKVLNEILRYANRWCDENKLTLNTQKTEYMIFGSKIRKNKAGHIILKIGNDILREVKSYKYLGTTLDENLQASSQLARLNQQIAVKLTTFRKIRNYMSENTAAKIYKATILPIIDYNDIIYMLLSKQQQVKLQRIQNRALRTVFKGKKLSILDMHEKAGLDYLEDRRELHLLTLMFDRTQDQAYIEIAPRSTRSADAVMLRTPKPCTSKLAKAPIYMGSKMWNELPIRMRKSKSRQELKTLFKRRKAGWPLEWHKEETSENSTVYTQ